MNRFKNSTFIDYSEESYKLELHQKVCGKWSKILNTFLFPFSNKMFLSGPGIYKKLVRTSNREDLDQTACSEAL